MVGTWYSDEAGFSEGASSSSEFSSPDDVSSPSFSAFCGGVGAAWKMT